VPEPAPRSLAIPGLSLVVLIGVSGSGKSTFARRHFGAFEVISSDFCRGLVADDENDQAATRDAFDVLGYIAAKRLAAGRLTVIDATNVQADARRPLIELARAHDVLPVAIVLDVPEQICAQRNASRADRSFGRQVIRRQHDQLRRSLRSLTKEGFRTVHVLRGVDEAQAAAITRQRLLTDFTDRTGPFDVIGDVHGCRAELEALLGRLGYVIIRDGAGRPADAAHPDGRTAVFLGDLVDRGPDSPGVLRLVMGMTAAGHALAVPGNHENKLTRALDGRNVQVSHGLAETLGQLAGEDEEFRRQVHDFCRGLVSHLMLDGGRLVVAHAGLKEAYQGRASGRVRSFALYGDTTGETDEYGLPVRYPWAQDYRGRAMVLYGHTPVPEPEWVNNTLCLDTGCVFGGRLTALRYPERELVSVPAERRWYEPARPFPPARATPDGTATPATPDGTVTPATPDGTATPATPDSTATPATPVFTVTPATPDGTATTSVTPGAVTTSATPSPSATSAIPDAATPATPVPAIPPVPGGAGGGAAAGGRDPGLLLLSDVTGKRVIQTRAAGRVTIREENAAGALEVMSRFAIDPRWLLYLPPTMAPCATSALPDLLEHPAEAFAGYAADGIGEVICEEKHMGSRAVVLAFRDGEPDAGVRARFGPDLAAGGSGGSGGSGPAGVVYTRTGRPFFDAARTGQLLEVVRCAIEGAGLWDELGTGWLLLDCELLPWSAKAGDLVRHQYAAVGAAARAALPAAVAAAAQAQARGVDTAALAARARARAASAAAFTATYRRYCWPVHGLDGIRLAPFQLLATDGATYHDRPHAWHLALADRLAAVAPGLFLPTRRQLVDTADPGSVAAGVAWWTGLTADGGEGMVVKPAAGLARGPRGLAQPGVKVRGREYLRIIYGPDYAEPANLARLRDRHLGRKRSLALREYALGVEALDRAAAGEPLWRVHEAVFGVLALESEPVDPRL
jgi:predicted kinase